MIPEKVQKILEDNNLTALEFEEGSTPTAVKAAARIGTGVSRIAKSILLKGKNGSFYLAVIEGDARISSSGAKKITGTKVRMATPEETLKATGFSPGGVCPFGVEGITIFIDKGLQKYETIYPAAGTDSSGVPVGYDKLLAVTGGIPCNIIQKKDNAYE